MKWSMSQKNKINAASLLLFYLQRKNVHWFLFTGVASMKIIIKTLQQTQHPLEVSASETILQIKERIHELLGHSIADQKLIYSGKVLANEVTVEQTLVKENDFFVLMVSLKNKPSNLKPAAAAEEVKKVEPTVPSATTTSSAPSDSSLVLGAEYEAAIARIVDMGYPKDQVEAAMKASFNNPDRAVEYLMNGIPDDEEADDAEDGPAAAQNASGNLDFLRNDPQFQQLRQAVQQNPELLQALIQQISVSNPRLMQLISSNQEEFMNLMEEGLDSDSTGAPADNSRFIQVTPAENEAIERLVSLGFEKARAIEAYFACDKDETLAANYLFDHLNEDDF